MRLFTKKHSIGNTIATLRKEKGWTQAELAEKLQVSDKAISKWEKDNSAPSIEFFPVLAELFGVSIDLLMTGKTPEKEVIIISKIELCAKNDDPKLLDSIGAGSRDENGNSLIYYIKKYNSLKVLKELFDRCSAKYLLFGHSMYVDLTKCADEILMLMKINCEIKYVKEACRGGTSLYNISKIEEYGYLPVIKYLIDNFETISPEQREYYFCKYDIIKPLQAWVSAYPYFLDYAYKSKNKKVFDLLLAKICATNTDYIESNNQLRREMGNYYSAHFRQWAERHCFINVLQSTARKAFERSEVELGRRLNAYCKEPLSEHDIESIAIDGNSKLTKEEKTLAKTIHGGIVCVDELLAIKDPRVIKKTLMKYPIHVVETLYKNLQENKLREIFMFAVDKQDMLLAGYVIRNDVENMKKQIVSYWSVGNKQDKLNSAHLYVDKKGHYVSFYDMSRVNGCNNIEKIIEFIEECRQRIIDEISLRLDKEKIIGDLTQTYFNDELSKGNTEMVIIKLCVRLEAILRSDFRYEGDFSEMLNKYCAEILSEREKDEKAIDILNKLRLNRNSIVHSEKCKEKLTVDEIKYCIDSICKLG